ncbi:MAG: GntR family transcriptional regulator [bacterium]
MSLAIEYNQLDKLVYDKIKEMILTRELKPGEQIIQDQLAKKLGVSRTPVRKALGELARESLIKMIPRGGTYVREFSLEEMKSIYEIREVLEGLACRKAAPIFTREQADFLRDLFKEAYASIREDDWKAYEKADSRFHIFIVEICQNDVFHQMVNTFHILTKCFMGGLVRSPKDTFPEHMDIIQALEDHNADLAEDLMRKHLRRSLMALEKRLSLKENSP